MSRKWLPWCNHGGRIRDGLRQENRGDSGDFQAEIGANQLRHALWALACVPFSFPIAAGFPPNLLGVEKGKRNTTGN